MSDTRFISTLSQIGWYPSDPVELRELIQSWIPTPTPQTPTQAVICPHAGIQFSGHITAQVLSGIDASHLDQILILGPSHVYPLDNQASIISAETIQTPLGDVDLHLPAINTLKTSPFITSVEHLHQREHSVQIMLPFLQTLGIQAPIVPIVMGQFSSKNLRSFSDLLRRIMTPKTLLLISSDFTHYGHPFGYVPFTDNIPHNLQLLDLTAAKLIQALELSAFEDYLDDTRATICGQVPIRTMMQLLPEGTPGHITHYVTSGELTGDWEHSVSYVGMTFSGTL